MLSHKLQAKPFANPNARRAARPSPLVATSRVVQGRATSPAAVDSPLLKGITFHDPQWSNVETEAQFFAVLQGEVAAGRCPKQLVPAWQDFYNNYKGAVMGANLPGHNEKLAAKVQSTIADCTLLQFRKPYTFPSFHKRMLEPYDYFEFGQRYVGSLIDFPKSSLGRPALWAQVASQLAAGHNVVLLANHQTEADPGVFAHMLMSRHPGMATEVVYVAGDRVVTDPLSKPFSMGRNLFCVHSKKHIADVPELAAQKKETNRKTLVAISKRFNEGGALVWIAPSGGRDRPKANGQYLPDPFDPAAVELMRSLLGRAKQPGHLYPMAMFSWPVMPPPKTVDKKIGERRLTNFTPVGISLAPELDVAAIIAKAGEDREAQQVALAQAAHSAVTQEYMTLEAACMDSAARPADYAQP